MDIAMEDATKKRKERLQALRAAKEAVDAGERPVVKPTLRFQGETQDHLVNRRTTVDESMEEKSRKRGPSELDITVEKAMSGVAEKAIAEEAERAKEDMDLFHLVPKKANWDLKRDRRTQASIVELIRRRLQGDNDGDATANLADAVAARQREATGAMSGSDEE
ncbi:hypothetical protein BDF22DRAFT_698265 [Syncephalis plumigaleata]|nr:hypothetical protein BDF22DRAFT_698265 [Syncephalis plumigaleata]